MHLRSRSRVNPEFPEVPVSFDSASPGLPRSVSSHDHLTPPPSALTCFTHLLTSTFGLTLRYNTSSTSLIMAEYTKLSETMSSSTSEENERDAFLASEADFVLRSRKTPRSWRRLQLPALYISNLLSLLVVFILALQNFQMYQEKTSDPSSSVWCK